MKAITLTQPYATLVSLGMKKIETRSWSTNYRGPLAIHAAKGLGPVGGKRGLKALCATEPFSAVLTPSLEQWWNSRHSLADMAVRPFMPYGAIVAVCDLIGCEGTDPAAWPDSGRFLFGNRSNPDYQFILDWPIKEPERSFGDYSPGRYMWFLTNIRTLPEPIPCKGALGLWEWDAPPNVP